eukprot:TRINITY_DN1088_c0_g2_i1.p2 TRINITY_DN1088_c0_g2~~TRINITY_DN1088_c0_g2_i1.p2  ORF type:complete len:113 (-),score=25.87 TRINITY_DN1088_c0_g2_i1:53-391(-)
MINIYQMRILHLFILFFITEEINKLEAKFLELLQYNVVVKSMLYAKYYFELRALFKNAEEFPLKPLDAQTADALEKRSTNLQNEEKSKADKYSSTFSGGGCISAKKAIAMIN